MSLIPATSQLDRCFITGLTSSGLNTISKVDNNTIAISGEVEGDYVIQFMDLYGLTMQHRKVGVGQVRGFIIITVEEVKYLVLTKQDTIELREAWSGKILDKLKIKQFDPCAICVASWDSVLVASWTQKEANMNQFDPATLIREIKIVKSRLVAVESKILKVNLTCVIGMVRVFHKLNRLIVLTSYNNDCVLAIDYTNGNRIWKMKLEYEGATIRPNGICSDGCGHMYIADTGLSYCRVFIVTSSGRILKKLLDTAGWCDDVTYISDLKKLIVLHDKSGTDKQDVSVYDIKYINKR